MFKKATKRMLALFTCLMTIMQSIVPTYAMENLETTPVPVSTSTLSVSVQGSGSVVVYSNGTVTNVNAGSPFSQSYAEGTNVSIEAIANQENVVESFTNNGISVPTFVAEQSTLRVDHVTTPESANFVVTFKEVVVSQEQEIEQKVDTEPIEEPKDDGSSKEKPSTEEEPKEEKKDESEKVDTDESDESSESTEADKKADEEKEEEESYGVSAFPEGFTGFGRSLSRAGGWSVANLEMFHWTNGIGFINNGRWTLSNDAYAFCGEGLLAPPPTGAITSDPVTVDNANVRKALYYGYGGPGDILTGQYGEAGAVILTNEALSNANCGTCISKETYNGYHWDLNVGNIVNSIYSMPDPTGFTAYKVDVPGSGINWQGVVSLYQDLFYGMYNPTGSLQISKKSANPEITDNNPCYGTMEGAEYGLYTDAGATNQVGTFRISADGTSNKIDGLDAGTYYIKEIKAPKGYALDTTIYPIDVVSGELSTKEFVDYPQSDPVGILLGKVDKETNANKPQGSASLAGAEFTVKYYKGHYDVDPSTQGLQPERKWVFKTNSDGFAYFSKDFLVSGDEFYYNSTNSPTIPIGTITIQETKAPVGYKINNEIFIRKVTLEGHAENVHTYNMPTIPEEVLKGKIKIAKKDKDTGKVIQVAGTVFDIYRGSTKVETIKTDDTGYATSKDLPYGTYTVKEAKAPNGYVVDVNQEAVVNITAEKTYNTELHDKRVTATLKLVKEDSETGNRPQGDATLEGAVYGLYAKEDILDPANDKTVLHKKDELVGKITTDENASGSVKDLYLGEYYWQEISPSTGYELDTTKYPVSATYKNDVTTTITVDKTVKEVIRTGEFDLIKVITDGNQSEIMTNEKGAEFVAVLKADYEANGNDIQKALEYAKANRTDKEYAVLTTNKNGYATSGKLAYGKYVIQQTKKGENAEETDMLDGIFTFEVTEADGQTIVKGGDTFGNALEMGEDGKMHYHINNRPMDYFLKLVKVDAESGKQIILSDATFKVKDLSTGEYVRQKVAGVWVDEFNTDKDGYVILPLKLRPGKYQLEEIKAPYNYLLNGTSIPFEVKKSAVTSTDEDGDAYIVVAMEDTRVKGSISFEKRGEVLVGSHKDENDNIVFEYEEQGLAGMEVTVYAKEDIVDPADGTVIYKAGDVVTTATTEENGKAYVDDLYLGSYLVRETQAPEGFVVSDKEYNVTLTYKDDHTAIISDSVSYVNERQKVNIDLVKLDDETNTPLSGAEFGLYATEDIYGFERLERETKPLIIEKGTLIETSISDDNGQVVFNADLPLGMYEIRELKAPIGYASSDEVIEVDATYQGQDIPTVEIQAEFKNGITKVEFSKVDASTNEELEGATQVVYPKGRPGEIFETWISTKEPHIIKGLEVGETYVWEETSAPYGFALAEKIEFTVEDTGEVQVAGTMKDEIVYGQLVFEKTGKQFTYTDIGMTDLGMVNTPVFEEMNILGAEITIYASEDITLGNGVTYYKADEKIETLVSDYEAVQSIKLPVGKYYYVETKAPIGFVKNEDKHYFEVEDNQTNELQVIESTLKNERPLYNIELTKEMEFSATANDKEAYQDVVFGIYTRDDTYDWKGNVAIEPDTLLATSGIDEAGHLVYTPELPVGNYYVKELATNSAYELDETEYDFSIDQSNDEEVTVLINEGKPIVNELKEFNLLVNKVDSVTKKNIISKEFEFTSFTDKECTKPIETKQANTEDGTVTFALTYGTTYIKETKAPQGYSLSPEVVEVTINDDGFFVNGKKVDPDKENLYSIIYQDVLLPSIQTGTRTNGGMYFMMMGFSILAFAVFFMIRKYYLQ